MPSAATQAINSGQAAKSDADAGMDADDNMAPSCLHHADCTAKKDKDKGNDRAPRPA
jgi:hypothetical protein